MEGRLTGKATKADRDYLEALRWQCPARDGGAHRWREVPESVQPKQSAWECLYCGKRKDLPRSASNQTYSEGYDRLVASEEARL